jgi:hypothetical protein
MGPAGLPSMAFPRMATALDADPARDKETKNHLNSEIMRRQSYFLKGCWGMKEKLMICHPWQTSARDSKTRFPNRSVLSRLGD